MLKATLSLYVFVLSSSLCVGHTIDGQSNRSNSPGDKKDIPEWKQGWLPDDCLEAAMDSSVGDDGLYLHSRPMKDESTIRFCYGGETECRSEKGSWSEGKPQKRVDGKATFFQPFGLKTGKTTLITIESKDKNGETCYRTVAVGRVEGKAYVLGVEDPLTTLSSLETPELPKPPSQLELQMAQLNAYRKEMELDPLPYDDSTIEAYRANAQPGIDAINMERRRHGRSEVVFDFVLSAKALTNNQLPNQPGALGYAHKYTGGAAQVWARGQKSSAAAVDVWVNHDRAWNDAHKRIVLGGYNKVGVAATPVQMKNSKGQLYWTTDYTANFTP